MSSRCRYCGDLTDALALSDDDACPVCAASVGCARCGHLRIAHVGSFRDGRGCTHVWVEEPSTLTTGCACAGFAPVESRSLDQALLHTVETLHGDASVPVG